MSEGLFKTNNKDIKTASMNFLLVSLLLTLKRIYGLGRLLEFHNSKLWPLCYGLDRNFIITKLNSINYNKIRSWSSLQWSHCSVFLLCKGKLFLSILKVATIQNWNEIKTIRHCIFLCMAGISKPQRRIQKPVEQTRSVLWK